MIHPKAISFNGFGILWNRVNCLFNPPLCFIEITIAVMVAIKVRPTPEYSTKCGGVKKDSTLTTPCHIISQLAAPTCIATPIETRR
jgi:hypothetical protein